MSDNKPVVGLVVPTTTEKLNGIMREYGAQLTAEVESETSGVHPDRRPVRRTRAPGKGRRSECVHLLTIAIQALQTAREAALLVRPDMPTHERERMLVPALSDAGLAVRSVQEAIERWEAGKS